MIKNEDEEAVTILLVFARKLNSNGNLTIDEQKATRRPLVSDRALEMWFEALTPLLESSHSPQDIKAIGEELQRAWTGDMENADSGNAHKYTRLLERVSTASAKEIPFMKAVEKLGLDPEDLTIKNSSLKPFPHQIMGK